MSAVRFSKQYVQPKPHEVDYWVDLATNPYGAVIKYYNGDDWEQWEGSGGLSSNFDVYTKKQINEMLAKKANVGEVDSKVDDDELAEVIKNIKIKEIGNDGVALVLFKYDNTNLAITLPTATAANAGVLSGKDFANFVKQHQLQALYSEMYDLFAEIRSKYQRKLKAGRNIKITSDNVISAEINVGPGSYDAALNELDEKINTETERAIAVEDRLEKRVDQHYVETDNLFVLKANKADVYTKSQVNDKLTGVYKVKGSKTYEKLPTSNSVGDVYNITNQFTLNGTTYPAGTNVVYTEYGWDALSGNFDVTALEEDIQTVADDLSKETLRAIEAETYNSNSIINLTNTAAELTTKLNTLTGNVYTVALVDDIVDGYLPLSGGTIDGVVHINGSTMWPLSVIGSDSHSATFSVGFANGNAVLRSEYRDRWSDIEFGHNTFKYESNDVLHSGNYQNYALPLTGGTLSGTTAETLSIDRTNANTAFISFCNNGVVRGYLGVNPSGDPVFANKGGISFRMWHTGNDGSGSGLDADLLDGIHARQFTRTVHVANTANSYVKILRFTRTNDKGWLRLSVNESNSNKTGASGEFIIEWGFIESTTSTRDLAISCLYSRFDIAKNLTAVCVDFDTFDLYWTTSAWCRTAFTLIDYAQTCTIDNFTPTALNELPTATYTSSLSGSMYINASSATKLQTARTIWGQSFDGTGNVNGSIFMNNDAAIAIKDNTGANVQLFHLTTGNALYIGYGAATNGYETRLDGYNLYLRSGTTHTTGLVLNSSGNITIGSSDLASTNYKLYVNGSAYIGNNLVMPNSYSLYLKDKDGTNLDSLFVSNSNNFHIGHGVARAGYNTYLDGNKITFRYGTTPSDGMVLSSNGNVGIGTTTPLHKLHVNGNILATGTINQESQRDLKNIIDEKVLSLDDMNTINPTRFTWKDNRDEDIHYGGIAEDIQQVIPEVVHKSGDNLTVEYANAAFAMVTSLVKHVKDLEQRLSKLEEDYKQLLLNNKQ